MHLRLLLQSRLCNDFVQSFRAVTQLLQVSVRLPCDLKLTKDLGSSLAAPNIPEQVVHVYNAGSLDVQPRCRHCLQIKAEPLDFVLFRAFLDQYSFPCSFLQVAHLISILQREQPSRASFPRALAFLRSLSSNFPHPMQFPQFLHLYVFTSVAM